VVTVTSTVAAACGGAVAVICVSDVTLKPMAATVPKDTPVAPVKPLPVMVIDVPPPVVPVFGLIEVTAGALAAV
jgi:hypothetical protein